MANRIEVPGDKSDDGFSDPSLFFRAAIREFADSYMAVSSLEEISKELGIPVKDIAKLDAGENPFVGIPDIDWSALAQKIAFYPDAAATELREALANQLGVLAEQIAVGNGSDELIDLVCRLYLEQGKTLVDFSPTFPMYKMLAKVAGAEVMEINREADFKLGAAAFEAMSRADLVFLANPNNPTGTVIEQGDIELLLQSGKPVVIDEAYYEFYGITVVPLLKKYPNLIVLRTFSKWAGLAGLRIGYAIADARIINKINAIKAPYNTNVVAQTMAKEMLEHKDEYQVRLGELIRARDEFIVEVNSLPTWEAIPSKASCVCIRSSIFTSAEVAAHLRNRGILVRPINNSALSQVVRISLAPSSIMGRVVEALKELG